MRVRIGSREVEGPDTSFPLQLKKLVKGTLLTSRAGTRYASSSLRLAGYCIETTDSGLYGSLSLLLKRVPSIVAAWFDELLDEETPTAKLQLQGITYHEGKTDYRALAAFNPVFDVYYLLPTFVFGAVAEVEKQREFLISSPAAE